MLCTFVESFQGQYKNGTNGTHDFRMFSASFLILRILILALFINHNHLDAHTAEMQGLFVAWASCIYAIPRPYKLNVMNNVDIVILFLLEILIFVSSTSASSRLSTYLILGSTLLLLVPHMILIFYICHKLAKKLGITQSLKRIYKTCIQTTRPQSEAEVDVVAESDADSLPDRLINPGEYEPVLPTREEHSTAEPTEDKEPVDEEPRRLTPVYTYGSIN